MIISPAQKAFESQQIVQNIQFEPNIQNVVEFIRSSPRSELTACCPTTRACLLFYAVQRKNDDEALTLCKILCDELRVCDPKDIDANQQSCIFFAARDGNAKCVEYLLQNGCHPDHKDSASQTALFYAARDGRLNTIEKLLSGGANINSIDNLGQTALFYAARDNRLETVEYMIEKGANVLARDRNRRTALYYAQRNQNKALIHLLKTAAGSHVSNDEVEHSASDQLDQKNAPRTSLTEPTNQIKSKASELAHLPAVHATPQGSTARKLFRLSLQGPLTEDASLSHLSAPLEHIEDFEKIAPSIAVWSRSASAAVVDIYNDSRVKWQPIALKIVDTLAHSEGGWVFSKPVDCEAWGCPDYYDVIPHPMDFATIRRKFRNHEYQKCRDFISDVRLIFANCFCYNKPDSQVVTFARNVESLFDQLVSTYALDTWVQRESSIEEWYASLKSKPKRKAASHQV